MTTISKRALILLAICMSVVSPGDAQTVNATSINFNSNGASGLAFLSYYSPFSNGTNSYLALGNDIGEVGIYANQYIALLSNNTVDIYAPANIGLYSNSLLLGGYGGLNAPRISITYFNGNTSADMTFTPQGGGRVITNGPATFNGAVAFSTSPTAAGSSLITHAALSATLANYIQTTNGNVGLGGSVSGLASNWKGSAAIGENGYEKVVVGPLVSSYSGATIGAHSSALNAWADLNVVGTNLIFRSGTNETEAMRIDSAGNVGIGTAHPVSRLTLAGGGNPNPNTSAELDYAGQNLTFMGLNAGGAFTLGSVKMVQPTGYYVDRADMVFSTNKAGLLSEQVRSSVDGNFGIGTTSPVAKLDVAGPIRSSTWYKWDAEVEWHTNDSGGSARLAKDGVDVPHTAIGRGINMWVLNREGQVLASSSYDVYANSGFWNTWADEVNARNNGEVIIVTSYDATGAVPTGGPADQLLKQLGSTELFKIPYNWRFGVVFAFVKGSYGIIEKRGLTTANRGMIRFAYQDLLSLSEGRYSLDSTDSGAQTKSISVANMKVTGVVRVREAGDLSMGGFRAGIDPSL